MVDKLLLSADEVAKLLGMSSRHVWNLTAQKKMPQPIHLGRTTRWSAEKIRSWVNSGCPQT